ncbi:MAG: hypothetical protein F6K26_36995 [Moorea sp. SIO2I5]|nr:hypothetical protein [Moorena sp. SIO2I5]
MSEKGHCDDNQELSLAFASQIAACPLDAFSGLLLSVTRVTSPLPPVSSI